MAKEASSQSKGSEAIASVRGLGRNEAQRGPLRRPSFHMHKLLFIVLCAGVLARTVLALDAAAVEKLGHGESDEKIEAISRS